MTVTTTKPKKSQRTSLNLMTMAEACLELSCSRKTIYRMVVNRRLPKPVQFTGHRQVYFERSEFIAACEQALGLRRA